MLRHIRAGEIYWFCTSCRQEGYLAVEAKHVDAQHDEPMQSEMQPTSAALPHRLEDLVLPSC
jgi:hypothetical protein